MFDNLSNLNELDISLNKIEYLPFDSFEVCKKLKKINFSDN